MIQSSLAPAAAGTSNDTNSTRLKEVPLSSAGAADSGSRFDQVETNENTTPTANSRSDPQMALA
ncbi:protein of unknown function [Agreia sp. COWG]|nr:protein of unknown function [Agreia sp. COWG]